MNKFRQWLFSLSRPVRWAVVLIILAGLTLTAVTVSATTWEYTNSPEFCGTACHTMPPEYTAYQVSPHARVDCVDCHLGQDSFLLTVPRKAREFNHVINALTKAYDPPIYVKNLRPARDTCEQCHNPDKFSSDTFVEIKRYADDKENTEMSNFLILKTGGGTQREGLGRGIYWHIENEVWFYSDDPLKQTIPYIREVTQEGEVIEYFDVEAGLPPDFGQQVEDQLHRMDCIDCHTRISHRFRSPSDAMDDALARGRIDTSIPEIKKQGVEVLGQNYLSTEEGLGAIEEVLTTYYKVHYPDFYAQNQEKVAEAVDEIRVLFNQTVFPNLNVGWQTHPDNVGHREFPGCFRCHDGKHTSSESKTIRLECNVCHSIPEIVEAGKSAPVLTIEPTNEPESHHDSNWLARHRYAFDQSCTECHDVSNPGGTDNSSFCSNSGCHATEWKFVGLDAPAIRALVAPPQLSGNGEPQPVPHPIGPRTDCTICHATDGVIPFPDNHASYEQRLCILCHEPTLAEGDEAVEAIDVPSIPHLVENQQDRCLDCHSLDGIVPYPDYHAEWTTDTCLSCHQMAEAQAEVSGEDKPKRPLIPHTLEGRADCLFCHSLDSIKPFPANHEGRDVEDCQKCHKLQEAETS
jgi:nitrate/TMAO reductase-like tetraheme cytochrome c subunit